jgi:MFS family permease
LKLARPSFFVLIALVGAFAIFSSTLSKTPVLPLFAQALHASPAQTGWIVMASTLPGILISYPAGALADRIGRRRVLLASLWVFASAPLLYLGVHSAAQLIALRFYHGFATAIFGTVAMAAIAARYPNERAARLSTYSSLTIAGRSAAPFVGGALLSLASFSAVYIACAISGVLALLIGWRLGDTPLPAHARKPPFWRSLTAVLRDRRILLVSLIEASQYLVFGAIEAFLALYAATLGLPAWQIGGVLGVQLLGVVLLKPLMGKLSDRSGRLSVILPGLLLGALSVALLPYATQLASLAVLGVLFGLGFAGVTSSTTALVADLSAAGNYGASLGVLATLMDVGQAIGPVLTGAVIAYAGYASAFWLLAAILLAAAGASALGLRGTAKKAAASA